MIHLFFQIGHVNVAGDENRCSIVQNQAAEIGAQRGPLVRQTGQNLRRK